MGLNAFPNAAIGQYHEFCPADQGLNIECPPSLKAALLNDLLDGLGVANFGQSARHPVTRSDQNSWLGRINRV